jgi:hypothetical protein
LLAWRGVRSNHARNSSMTMIHVCVQCQAEHAAQSVKDAAGATAGAAADAAGAAADSAQLQQHRAADAVQEVCSDAAAYVSLPCNSHSQRSCSLIL